jgi:hypothetical protein
VKRGICNINGKAVVAIYAGKNVTMIGTVASVKFAEEYEMSNMIGAVASVELAEENEMNSTIGTVVDAVFAEKYEKNSTVGMDVDVLVAVKNMYGLAVDVCVAE